MPWLHVPEAMLTRFLAGELDDEAAGQVGLHLDDCPHCRGRVEAVDPLTRLLASAPVPEVPPALARAVVARARRPDAASDTTTPVVVVGLAAAAIAVFALAGAPGELLSSLASLGSAAAALARAVELPVAFVTPVWLAAAVLTFAAAAVTARRLDG
ncbi:zf-HC2 domain-containing protein, partial [Myxococcota bacterium]|nr:zf-HC2 domain-containing protein [Myxococcota bacterium]